MYQVSNLGRVKSCARSVIRRDGKPLNLSERILKPGDAQGYQVVSLFNGSNRRYVSIHRLVAETFIPNPAGKSEVNHIDEDKSNNNVENLEWVSHIENINHGTGNRRKGLAISKATAVIDPSGKKRRFTSRKEAARFAGLKSDSTVCRRLRCGSFTTLKGYTFVDESRYEDD